LLSLMPLLCKLSRPASLPERTRQKVSFFLLKKKNDTFFSFKKCHSFLVGQPRCQRGRDRHDR
jgi:hypothetical protein